MAYLRGERQQTNLFPASLEEYVGSEDPVRVYDAFVDQLDFQPLGLVLNDQQIGPPEFDPQSMLKLWVYGAGTDRGQYAVRGWETKIRANAGMRESWSKERCERVLQRAQGQIEKILRDCDNMDAAEEAKESLGRVPGDLAEAKALREKVKTIYQELQRSSKSSFNTTDPDCRHVQGRQGTHARTHHRQYWITDAKRCRECIHFVACTKSWSGRKITRAPFEEIRKTIQDRYESAVGQAIYARRQAKVEHPFGHIKRNLGVQAFLLRRLAHRMVPRVEFTLHVAYDGFPARDCGE